MAILNSDGSEYQLSSLQQYDKQSIDQSLLNQLDQEQMDLFGSPILYYEILIQTSQVDPLYHENRSRLFRPDPIQLMGMYEPIPSQNQITAFGIDSPDEMIFGFNYKSVLNLIGHAPKIGSRLFTPHLNENWEIIQRSTGEFQLWGLYRIQILAKRFQESTTSGDGKIKQPSPEFRIE